MTKSSRADSELMNQVVSLCKRRGFVFQSSEIYGGLKSCYDYGPLGVELKRNIASEWWRSMVHEREDVVGLDASIIMHPQVWKTSGHVSGFSDPLVDCFNCKERFRADKAPQEKPGTEVTYRLGGKADGPKQIGCVSDVGYICPVCGSPDFGPPRQFNLMFRSSLGPVDPYGNFIQHLIEKSQSGSLGSAEELRADLEKCLEGSQVYLRPETAQAMFVQFLNVQKSMSMKIPFGIAQQGKSFRNEIVTEHFIFRSCEFEQMELEFFIPPGTQNTWLEYWREERLSWYQRYANKKDFFRLRRHDADELAHYSDDCYDIEYMYPWGWDELEGVASRTDYDLKRHAEASGTKLIYVDPNAEDPETGKAPWRFTPYVIEPAAGLTRSVLCYLLDAYTEQEGVDHAGAVKTRKFLKLDPRFSPYKAGILPLLKKDGHPECGEKLVKELRARGIPVSFDLQGSIGKRYSRHDEIGTPYCVTIDGESIENKTVTVRNRDDAHQERISLDQVPQYLESRLK